MSTRCTVEVVRSGMVSESRISLYHHNDGDLDYMVPCMAYAERMAQQHTGIMYPALGVGEVAAFLCASDLSFQPEACPASMHGDRDYAYIIHLDRGGNLNYPWEVTVLKRRRYSTPAQLDPIETRWELWRIARKHVITPRFKPRTQLVAYPTRQETYE